AARKIGAVTAEVYTFLQPKDYAYYLDYTAPAVVVVYVITLDRMRDAAARSTEQPILLAVGVQPEKLGERDARFEALVAHAAPDLAPARTTRDDIAVWKFTTGSTGHPKA